ncbi:DJ-1/PfpI family protein [Solicola gregarius]|uniref:DJ-1/PfpI family protein n=1 Tax=Solicola gregarius TaxID=2908642 RepID=A0AA46YMB7_9ACTN|nr:DJ-1/PfpI family protein [Solicola gregarius]UYM05623.1 DJ-1/PfpI family protein [Solicola gregarius]
MKNVVLYLTDTMADWEYGHAVAGLAMAEEVMPGRFRLLTVSDGAADNVTTKGGLRIQPDATLAELDESQIAMLILPGADTWAEGHDGALSLAERLLASGTPVAAICGATLGLAHSGLLDGRTHTSNARDFLTGVPGYNGADQYVDAKVAVDRDVITAPAVFPVDFAKAIFERLELFPPAITDAWYGLYSTGERRFYDDLLAAAQ